MLDVVAMLESGRAPTARSLELFFDYTCPYAYLASTQAQALAARMGVPLTYKPILLGGVFKAVGTAQNLSDTLGAAKAAHNRADMDRWARRFGVALRMPAGHPLRSVEALRATLAAGIDPKVIDGFYAAYWRTNEDIADRAVITRVLREAGHDPESVLAKSATASVKDDLRARTDEAIARGVFGVPTFFVDHEHMYWGQDRMDFVEGVAAKPSTKGTASGARPNATFYWDFSSPFAYLAAAEVSGLAARTGATIEERPILLGGLFRNLGTADVPLATFSPAKQRYILRDIVRWCERRGLPFVWPSRFPMRSLAALRMWLALPPSHRTTFRDAVFRAAWGEDRDIEDVALLASLVGDDAIANEAARAATGDAVKAALRANTDEAMARGVFGVPSFVVGGEVYWGQDRMVLVEEALATSA